MKRKLTERQVRLIREDETSKYGLLAERFGISVSTVANIKSGLRELQLKSLGKWGNNAKTRKGK